MPSEKLPIRLRWFIVEEKKKNTLPSEIKTKVKSEFNRDVSYYSIRETYNRYLETGDVIDLPRSGRPKALSDREERNLVRLFVNNVGTSVRSVVKNQDEAPISEKPVSRQTVTRTLRMRGFIPRFSQRGKGLTQKNKFKRVKFAQKHKEWTYKDWEKVVFTDEARLFPKKTVSSVRWSRVNSVSVPEEERNMGNYFVNVWGYLRSDGEVRIFKFLGTMGQIKYTQTLEKHLYDAVAQTNRHSGKLLLQQDNAPYHTGKVATKWFGKKRINRLLWPPQSPDLSPIENIWAFIKNELWNRRAQIKSSSDVWNISNEIVHNLTGSYIRSLYESLPKRIESVIEKKGNRINY